MLGLAERQRVEKAVQIVNGHIAQLRDIFAAHIDAERLFLQSFAAAFGAGKLGDIAFDLRFHAFAFGILVAPRERVDETFPLHFIGAVEVIGIVFHIDLFVAVTVHKDIVLFFGQIFDGNVHIDAVMARHGLGVHFVRLLALDVPAADLNGALAQRLVFVGTDERLVHHLLKAQARAFGTGSVRRIEGKEARLDLLDADTAVGAGILDGI